MAEGHSSQIRLLPRTDISLDQEPSQADSRRRLRIPGNKMPLNSMHNSNSRTLQPQSSFASHIKFQPEHHRVTSQGPGVGTYNLSSSLVKPAFETYEKNKEVILVKINHVGGTSSFKNQQERFEEGQSIYESSQTPGPGSYKQEQSNKKLRKVIEERSPAYDAIREMLRGKREKVGSTPSYVLGDKAEQLQYNGLPRHLQDMYLRLRNQSKDEKIMGTTQNQQQAIKFKRRVEKYPIRTQKTYSKARLSHQSTLNRYEPIQAETKQHGKGLKMTDTMMRMSRQREVQASKMRKIRMILDDKRARKRNLSIDFDISRRGVSKVDSRQIREGFNRNMVNMLYDHQN